MIQLKTLYSQDFIEEYSDFCLNYIRPRLDAAFEELEGELRERLELYFSNTSLRFLLSSDALVLEVAFEEIFEGIPILAERFNPKLFFSSLNVDTKCDHLNLRTNQGKLAIARIKENVLAEIETFLTAKPSILLGEVVENMDQATKASEIKAQLGKLTSIVNGTIQANDNFKAKFPPWLECLSKAFNYDYVIARFGAQIVNLIDLHYCPYCAEEGIEPFNRYRPAIDHYFPKSKFPFLALSLHNFVPSGDRCNSRFKKNNEMIGYFNPALDELPNAALFDFEYPLGRDFIEEEIRVTVNNLSPKLHANSRLFELEDVYNKFGTKREFKNLHDRINLLEGLGREEVLNNPQQTRILLNVDLTLSQKKVRYQKFLVDALNFLAESNLVVNSSR
ncbi:hypothetical protein OTK59_02240 [Vibrio natriegens]|uniref:hypothetical protein n=1 Tax=Vibrio natriegens TaxID=691 RepID=UPI0022833E9B|nr:hypothetical protein [Vibrio natriegens]ELA9308263.1 hypothetical protein [Vibrio parahaemolyticus]MCY9875375.1 hypothetical protein [Vibrio natriegens]